MAIREDYVDGVDCLLRFEEQNHKPGTAYSWEAVDQVSPIGHYYTYNGVLFTSLVLMYWSAGHGQLHRGHHPAHPGR